MLLRWSGGIGEGMVLMMSRSPVNVHQMAIQAQRDAAMCGFHAPSQVDELTADDVSSPTRTNPLRVALRSTSTTICAGRQRSSSRRWPGRAGTAVTDLQKM
jgi:hypothetical protein